MYNYGEVALGTNLQALIAHELVCYAQDRYRVAVQCSMRKGARLPEHLNVSRLERALGLHWHDRYNCIHLVGKPTVPHSEIEILQITSFFIRLAQIHMVS